MDITSIVNDLTTSLAPILPYLLKAGEKSSEEIGKRFGGEVWEQTKAIWTKLKPKVEAKPAALEAAHDVAHSPEDEEAQANLRYQLKKLLSEDGSLADEISSLLKPEFSSLQVNATGKNSMATGRDSTVNTTITGDGNAVGNNNRVSVTKGTASMQGASLDEFINLLGYLQRAILSASFDDRARNVIISDIEVLETQAKDANPSLPIIESKLKGIEAIANRTPNIESSSGALLPTIHKLINFAQQLFK